MKLIRRLVLFIKEVIWKSFFRVITFKKEPIFIVGCERSGTTLLLAILGAHPSIYTIPFETNTYHYHQQRKSKWYNKFLRRKKILGLLFKRKIPKNANRFCEKTPRSVLYIKEILSDYNNKVKIIHIVRDGRDVITSNHPDYPERKNFVTIDFWKQRVNNALKFSNNSSVFMVKYEDLICDFNSTINKILEFLDEPYHDKLSEFWKHTNVVSHSAWSEKIQPIYKQSALKYKTQKNSPDIIEFEKDREAMELLKNLGY